MPALSTPPAPSATQGGPGPTGPPGQSAYTFTAADITGYDGVSNLNLQVDDVSWIGPTAPAFITGVGSFQVTAVNTTTKTLTLLPLKTDIGTPPYNIPTGTMVASTGFPGLNGATGNTGPQGPVGAQGIAGPQGLQGPTGQAGSTGATGPQGPTGQQGAAGPPGTTGATGSTGPQGPIGVKGNPGPQGIQGIQGPNGPQGGTGVEGPSGPQGIQGPPGPAVTAQGNWNPSTVYAQGDLVTWQNLIYIGLRASQNAQPDTHPQDWAVYSSVGIEGPQGPPGTIGPPGAQGPQGVPGPQGPIGADGATGATGAEGSAGPTGDPGPAGPVGATGATGPLGPTGPQGVPGPSVVWRGNWTSAATYNPNDGVSRNGNSYVAVATNTNQPPEANPTLWQLIAQQGGIGPTGPQGATGPAGPIGPIGPTGSQGVTGPAGATGPPGPTRVSGDANNTAMLGTDNLLFVPALGLATTTKIGALQKLSGNVDGFLDGTNSFRGVADATQSGLLKQLSGRSSDYVGGDNACHPIGGGFVSLTGAYSVVVADISKYFICSGGSWTLTLPAPVNGFIIRVRNDQGITGTTGTITLTPASGTINGLASLLLLPAQECTLISDGTNWRTIGRQRVVVIGTIDITVAVATQLILLPLGYRLFEIDICGLISSVERATLVGRFSIDGGTTILSTYYYDTTLFNSTATAAAASYLNNTAQARLGPATRTLTTYSDQIQLKVYPGNGTTPVTWLGQATGYDSTNNYLSNYAYTGSLYNMTGIANAMQIYMSSGNIAQGSIIVRGLV